MGKKRTLERRRTIPWLGYKTNNTEKKQTRLNKQYWIRRSPVSQRQTHFLSQNALALFLPGEGSKAPPPYRGKKNCWQVSPTTKKAENSRPLFLFGSRFLAACASSQESFSWLRRAISTQPQKIGNYRYVGNWVYHKYLPNPVTLLFTGDASTRRTDRS